MPLVTEPTPASVIKSIQRGSTSLAPNGSSNITINSVDTSKSFVSISCKNGSMARKVNNNTGDYWSSTGALIAGGALTSATNLAVSVGNFNGTTTMVTSNNATIYWEVVEYV
jgi:hypothetical protein